MKKEDNTEVVDYDKFGQSLEDRKNKVGVGAAFDREYFLKGKPAWLVETFEKIDDMCKRVQTGVRRTYLQTYIRYTHRNAMFCKVLVKREHIKVYLRLDYKTLEQKPPFIRDYFAVSHQQWIELYITENELLKTGTILLDLTHELIKKSFQRILKNPKMSKFSTFGKKEAVPEFVTHTPTKFRMEMEIGSDGFVDLKLRIHKSQLPKLLEKLIG